MKIMPWKDFNKNMAIAVEYDLAILMKSLINFIIEPWRKIVIN